MRRAACLLFSVAAVSAILVIQENPAIAQSADRDTLGEPRNEGAGRNSGGPGPDGSTRNAPPAADGSNEAGAPRRQRRQDAGTTSTADGDAQTTPANSAPAAPQPSRAKARDPIEEKLNRAGSVAELPPHPLAAAHPGHNVIVCVAGCPKGRDTIVHMGRQVANSGEPSGLVAAVAGAAAPETGLPQQIVCLAGCYGVPKAYKALAPKTDGSAETASATGVPSPMLVSLPAKPAVASQAADASDDGEPRSRKSRAVPAVAAAKVGKASAHWFTSRFRR